MTLNKAILDGFTVLAMSRYGGDAELDWFNSAIGPILCPLFYSHPYLPLSYYSYRERLTFSIVQLSCFRCIFSVMLR